MRQICDLSHENVPYGIRSNRLKADGKKSGEGENTEIRRSKSLSAKKRIEMQTVKVNVRDS